MAAKSKGKLFLESLKSLFDEQEINEIAKQTGAWQRFRKITPWLFLHALIWFFCSENKRAITSLVDEFILAAGKKISYGSLHPRFTANMVEFLKRIIRKLIDKDENKYKLKNLGDLSISDSTVFKLSKKLSGQYPGSKRSGSEAAMKIHLQMSPFRNAPLAINISSERTDDRKYLNIDEGVKGKLLLFDRGYFSYRMFNDICKFGGLFVSRYFSRSKPRIVADLTTTGQKSDLSEKEGSWLFTMDSILDWQFMLTSLKENRTAFVERIWRFLNKRCKEQIGNWTSGSQIDESLKHLIIKGFNETLGKEGFFDSTAFKDLKMTTEGRKFLKKGLEKLNKNDLQRFNRLIFESVYPQQIAKSRKEIADLIKSYNGDILDFEVEISLEKTRSIKIKGGKLSLRFTAIWNPETSRYHTYISNLDTEFTPEDVARIYSARWEVELVFKELKSYYHINAFRGEKKEVVESLIYGAILTMITARNVFKLLCKLSGSKHLRPEAPRILRMADVMRVIGPFLHVLIHSKTLKELEDKIFDFAVNALKDPNINRPRNIEGLVAQFGS
jgi:IS4 transposase